MYGRTFKNGKWKMGYVLAQNDIRETTASVLEGIRFMSDWRMYIRYIVGDK